MNLHLDKRQRAMLAEMGVTLWTPPPAAHRARGQRDAMTKQPQPAMPQTTAAAPTAQPAPPIQPAARKAPLAPTGVLPPGIANMDWEQLEAAVAGCRACGLCTSRTQTVFGVGDRQADWLVVGEAPGRDEDRQGEPFVGQSGKLLDNMLAAMGLSRHASAGGHGKDRALRGVYIANVVKCRPPGNRNPQPEEIARCEPYLQRQIALLQPKIILAMGRFAVQSLLDTNEPIGRLRGRVHEYAGVPVVVTYHPAYLLRELSAKAKAWQDLCLALATAQGQ